MSFEEGKSITDLKYLKENNINLTHLANILANIFNKQIFEFGFVHADPHSGNIFVRKENEEVKIVLLDHGLYRTLDGELRRNYAKMWQGIITQNKDLLISSCESLNVTDMELFIAIITSKTYKDVMSEEKKFDSNRRLSQKSE